MKKNQKAYDTGAKIEFKDQHANKLKGTIADVIAAPEDSGRNPDYLVLVGKDPVPVRINHSQIISDKSANEVVTESGEVGGVNVSVTLDKTDNIINLNVDGVEMEHNIEVWRTAFELIEKASADKPKK